MLNLKSGMIVGCLALLVTVCEAKPKVMVLATGGTIAGAAATSTQASYTPSVLLIDTLLKSVPELQTVADVKGDQVFKMASQAMTPAHWLTLAKRAQAVFDKNEADAIVVTHGTDTLEETAYFLSLTVKSKNPIVVVGAMRPSTALGADGPANLYEAVCAAVATDSQARGVMVLMNDRLFTAREVTKKHTTNPAAFGSTGGGVLGEMYDNTPWFKQAAPTVSTALFDCRTLSDLPKVDILYGYAGDISHLVRASVASGAKGIVIAGVGDGNVNPNTEEALIEARKKGVAIVRCSRVGAGAVLPNMEVNDTANGFIAGGSLSAQKARILLMLALATQVTDIQGLFLQ